MIQLTPQMRLLLAVEPVDFRKGIDGLVAVCRQRLAAEPLAGGLFVFSNRRRQALKLLVYDGQGFWLAQSHKASATGPHDCHVWVPPQGESRGMQIEADLIEAPSLVHLRGYSPMLSAMLTCQKRLGFGQHQEVLDL